MEGNFKRRKVQCTCGQKEDLSEAVEILHWFSKENNADKEALEQRAGLQRAVLLLFLRVMSQAAAQRVGE